jgi:molybdate transport system substrate-binding protein
VALTVYAAGSLRAALTRIAHDFEAGPRGTPVRLVFGAAGLLRTRLEAGEPADVYASANLVHPQALADAGRAGAVQCFARNRLCVLAAPGFALGRATLVERLLDPAVRLGTSTPGADPSGDYAFELFDRFEASGSAPGTAAALKAKALRLTGAGQPRPPLAGNVYGAIVAAGWADAFVTYRTNAAVACRERRGLQVFEIPAAVDVMAVYGLTVLQGGAEQAGAFAAHVLSEAGQARLRELGFAPP